MSEQPTKVVFEGALVDGVAVSITSMQESVQTYTLSDGTILNLRCVLTQAIRLKDKFKQDGDPFYVFQHQVAASTIAPVSLKDPKKAK